MDNLTQIHLLIIVNAYLLLGFVLFGLSANDLVCQLVWSKYSCGFLMVIFQQSTEPFPAIYGRIRSVYWLGRVWKQEDITFPLMISLFMIVR